MTQFHTQVFFAATGVSDSDLVKGVRFTSGGASTNSIVMRARSGTVRYIETFHRCAWFHGLLHVFAGVEIKYLAASDSCPCCR